MKVGFKANAFNFAMLDRRKELGLTQKDLSTMCRCAPGLIGKIERLQQPPTSPERLNRILVNISAILEIPFDDLFPADYLEAVVGKRLPRRQHTWVREISVGLLTQDHVDLPQLMDDADEALDRELLKASLHHLMNDYLPEREREIIQLRYLQDDGMTLAELAEEFGISRVRVDQLQQQALSRLRRVDSLEKLRPFLGTSGYRPRKPKIARKITLDPEPKRPPKRTPKPARKHPSEGINRHLLQKILNAQIDLVLYDGISKANLPTLYQAAEYLRDVKSSGGLHQKRAVDTQLKLLLELEKANQEKSSPPGPRPQGHVS